MRSSLAFYAFDESERSCELSDSLEAPSPAVVLLLDDFPSSFLEVVSDSLPFSLG